MRLEQLDEIVSELEECTPEERRHFFSDDSNGLAFWYYYYPQNFVALLADFHYDWIRLFFETDLNLLIEGFR